MISAQIDDRFVNFTVQYDEQANIDLLMGNDTTLLSY